MLKENNVKNDVCRSDIHQITYKRLCCIETPAFVVIFSKTSEYGSQKASVVLNLWSPIMRYSSPFKISSKIKETTIFVCLHCVFLFFNYCKALQSQN